MGRQVRCGKQRCTHRLRTSPLESICREYAASALRHLSGDRFRAEQWRGDRTSPAQCSLAYWGELLPCFGGRSVVALAGLDFEAVAAALERQVAVGAIHFGVAGRVGTGVLGAELVLDLGKGLLKLFAIV